MRLIRSVAAAAVVVAAVAVPAVGAEAPMGALEMVSVSTDGVQGDLYSEHPQMSFDGRYVLFSSEASNLVPDDTNNAPDLFLHDRASGSTTRVSTKADGEQISGGIHNGALSGDGRYVVFWSSNSTLVPNDTNGRSDVFRKDVETGAIELVSVTPQGTPGNNSSLVHEGGWAINYDGRYIVFPSQATDLVPGTPAIERGTHIFLRDMQTGTVTLVSKGSDGVPATKSSQVPSISGDGSTVVFESHGEWDPRDRNGVMDAYAHRPATGETELISVGDRNEASNQGARRPRPSFDGRYVVFDSLGTNLVPRDQGGITPDVFVRDLLLDRTEKVSANSDGAAPDDVAYRGAISGDGRFVAYWSSANNHHPDKTNVWVGDIWIRDRVLGTTMLLSRANDGNFGTSTSQLASIAGDGRSVAFMSNASNLVANDTNGTTDVFARTIGDAVGFVDGIALEQTDGSVTISGIPRATGAELAAADDVVGDRPAALSEAIGDISAASAAYRADLEQLYFKIEFAELPTPQVTFGDGGWVRPGVSLPGAVYGVSFQVAGVPYEIRLATPQDLGRDVGLRATPELYECSAACTPVLDGASGSYGTTGHDINLITPVATLGAAPGDAITNIRAFAGPGSAQTGAFVPGDELTLADAAIPATSTAVAIAPAGTATADISFADASAPDQVAETLSTAGLEAGEYDAWARHCLGDTCGFARRSFTIAGSDAETTPTVLTLVLERTRGDIVARATLTDESGSPIESAPISFALNNESIVEVVTDSAGRASITLHRNEIKKGDVVSASFAGTDLLDPSATSAVMDQQNI